MIKLDMIAHIVVGTIVMLVAMIKFDRKFYHSYLILLAISIMKEVNDSGRLQNTIEENLRDLFFSMLFPNILLVVRYFKRKVEEKENEEI